MSRPFWLIQTGKYRSEKKTNASDTNPFKPIDENIQLHYMGSAEFEYGSVPRCFQRIVNNSLDYEVVVTDIINTNNVPLILFCNKNNRDDLIKYIKEYINEPYRLKEACGLEHHVKNPPEYCFDHYKWSREYHQFWLDIDHDWFATFGGTDRVKIFEETLRRCQEKRRLMDDEEI